MALQHGTKARRHSQASKQPKVTARNRVVSFVAFVFLTLAAVALVGATMLVPAWANRLVALHEKELAAAYNADLHAQLAAGDRMIEALQTDPLLIERVAVSHNEFEPINQRMIIPEGIPLPPPDTVYFRPAPRPARPPEWVLRAGQKLDRPKTRRGLLVLAGGILLTAGFMLSPASPQATKKSRSRA